MLYYIIYSIINSKNFDEYFIFDHFGDFTEMVNKYN